MHCERPAGPTQWAPAMQSASLPQGHMQRLMAMLQRAQPQVPSGFSQGGA